MSTISKNLESKNTESSKKQDPQEKEPLNKSNIITFWMIVLVFALPPVSAYFMYYSGIMPDARINKGALILPESLPEISLHTIDGEAFSINKNHGKWTMLMFADSTCDKICQKNIYLMRQVRTSLGKDSHNTERLLILNEQGVSDEFSTFLKDYPGMPVVASEQEDAKAMEVFFTSVANNTKNKLFLIDPNGKVMMHYENNFEPKDLLSDLKRLILVNSNDLADNKE